MVCDEYRRLHAACLVWLSNRNNPMSGLAEFTLAQDCLALANNPRSDFRHRKCADERRKSKLTGLNSHTAVGLRAATALRRPAEPDSCDAVSAMIEAGRVQAAVFIASNFVALRHAITREIACNLRAKIYVGSDMASGQSLTQAHDCGSN